MPDEPIISLRQAQLDALAETAMADFIARAYEALRPWPSSGAGASVATRDRAAAHAWVRDGIEHAARWDIRSERDVVAFLEVRRRLGEAFDEQPWAREILAGERRHTTQSKARLLLEMSRRHT